MQTRITLSISAVLSLVLAFSGRVSAQEDEEFPPEPEQVFPEPEEARSDRLPTALAERPLTLPRGTLRVDTDVNVFRTPVFFADDDVSVVWRTGAGFGITDDLEVGAYFLPLQFAPEVEYGDATVYGMFRFLSTDGVEAAARAEVVLPTQNDLILAFSVPVLLRAGDRLRIDTGAQVMVNFNDDTIVGLGVPANQYGPLYPHPLPVRSMAGIPFIVNLNITDMFFAGLRSGFTVADFGEFGDSIVVPLGAQIGYTIPTDFMLADVTARFEFPWFMNTIFDEDAEIRTDTWQVTLAGNFYFDIM